MRGKGDTRRIAELAAAQKGLVTRRQMLGSGASERRIDHLVEDGWLHRVHTGVYAVGHPALTRHAWWLAALLALGQNAVLSHTSAGALWAILPRRLPIPAPDVTVLTTAGIESRNGITVHRARLADRERTIRDGIPTTTLPRTLLDLSAVLDARALAHAFEEAQVRHRLRPAELTARPGRRGAVKLRALLARAADPGQVESVLELRFLALCAAHGLPRPLTQVRIGRWRADFWFPAEHVVVETDGARFHATAAKRARDERKQGALEARGERVLRLTWAEVARRPAAVAERVREALATANVRAR